jgi:exosortase
MTLNLPQGRINPALKWGLWIGLIAGTTIVIFWQEFLIVVNEGLVSEGYSQVLLLPFIIGYLIYRKRHTLDAVQNLPEERRLGDIWTVVGGSLILTTFVVYFYSPTTTYALEWRLLMVPIFVSGAVLAIFGYRFWRVLAVPIAFLLFFEPYFVQLTNPYWGIIAYASAIGAHSLLSLFGYATTISSTLTGPVIETANGAFDIGLGSSGLQTLVGYTLFATFAVYILFGSTAKRVFLFVLGYPLLVLINILRIAVIVALNAFVSATAASIFHLTGGLFLVFLGTLLLLFVGERLFKLRFGPNSQSAKPCRHELKGQRYCLQCGWALPSNGPSITGKNLTGVLVVVAGMLLLLSILTPAYAQSLNLSSVDLSSNSPAVLSKLLPQIPEWNLTYFYRDNSTQAALQQDAALVFYYQRNDTSTSQLQTVYAIVQVGTGAHRWEDSLVNYPQEFGLPTAKVIELHEVNIGGSSGLPATFFVFQRPGSNLTEAVLEWVTRAPFLIGGSYEERFLIMSIYQNVPSLVDSGLMTNSSDTQQYLQGVLDVYMPFAIQITNYQGVSQSVSGTVFPLLHNIPIIYSLGGLVLVPDSIAVAGYFMTEVRRRRTVGTIVGSITSKDDLLLLRAIRGANADGSGFLGRIRDSLVSDGGATSELVLASELDMATILDIVEVKIIEDSGEPYYAWKLA